MRAVERSRGITGHGYGEPRAAIDKKDKKEI